MGSLFSSFCADFLARLDGPLHFRFIVQPLVAILLGIRDGRRDARDGGQAYLWKFLTMPEHRRSLIESAVKAICKVFVIALALDVAYQFLEWRALRPLQAVLTATLLAVLPYLLVRGPVNRLVRMGQGPGTPARDTARPGKESTPPD